MFSTKTTELKVLGLLLTAALLLPAALSGCTDAQKEQMAAQAEARKRQMAEKALRDRAQEYWELVRWQSWSQAASYLEAEQEQLSFLRSHTDATQTSTPIQDVEIEYVFVGTKNVEEAEIRVRYTEVVAAEARVATRTTTQQWYKHHGRWWVDPTAPMGREETGSLDESAVHEEPPADLPTTTVP